MSASVIALDGIAPVPWRNGGGLTRELLTWPRTQDWVLRVSVAEIRASGPFSVYPGVERWFAVLSGAGVELQTAGIRARRIATTRRTLHRFAGEAATYCRAGTAPSVDFNVMVRRARARLRHWPLPVRAQLRTHSDWAGLFVAGPSALTLQARLPSGAATERRVRTTGPSLVSWPNARREHRTLRCTAGAARGWWLELELDASAPPSA